MTDTLHILLIDDNPDDRLLVARQLQREFPGLRLTEVDGPADFAQALLTGKFDLVISDYALGWTNGLAVLRAVKERWPECPCIMFTGSGDEEVAVAALKAGLDDYILKSPRHFMRLPASVAAVLEHARQRHRAEDAAVEAQRRAQELDAIVSERERLLAQLAAEQERLRAISRRLVEVQETERRRIARELHDEIGQALTALKINLQAMQLTPAAAALKTQVNESIAIVERTLQQVRNLSLDLRPSLLDDLGLVTALRWYLDRQAQRAGLRATFEADPPDLRLSPELETTCFRVAQEALTNVVRHAHGRTVRVALRRRADVLEMTIADDGIGFDVPATLAKATHGASLGLLGIQERVLLAGGQVEIVSAPGRGTEIRARFPV